MDDSANSAYQYGLDSDTINCPAGFMRYSSGGLATYDKNYACQECLDT